MHTRRHVDGFTKFQRKMPKLEVIDQKLSKKAERSDFSLIPISLFQKLLFKNTSSSRYTTIYCEQRKMSLCEMSSQNK